MTAQVYQVSNSQLLDLISCTDDFSISDEGMEITRRTIENSTLLWVGMNDDKLLGFWGLIPPTLLSNQAYLWLHTTKQLSSHEFVFIRHSQRIVNVLLEQYPIIVGHGVKGADKSLRWLRWLGAEFSDPQGKLIPFQIKAKQ